MSLYCPLQLHIAWFVMSMFETSADLLMRFLQVLHQHGDDDVNKNELSHKNEDNKEDGCDDG